MRIEGSFEKIGKDITRIDTNFNNLETSSNEIQSKIVNIFNLIENMKTEDMKEKEKTEENFVSLHNKLGILEEIVNENDLKQERKIEELSSDLKQKQEKIQFLEQRAGEMEEKIEYLENHVLQYQYVEETNTLKLFEMKGNGTE